jgi:beta-lactamase regulating signal transducer with metallopeptidase domain
MMFSQGISELIAERALNSIPVGLAIVFLAWLGLKAFSRQGSRVRFAVWFLALLGIVAVPFVPSIKTEPESAAALHAGITMSGMWAEMILGVWIAVVSLASVRLLYGIGKLWAIKRKAKYIGLVSLPLEAQRAIAEFRSTRPVEICISHQVRIPTAVGFFKPTVLLPEWALTDLSEQDLTAVLLHELAHLRRLDDWTNLAQKILGAIFFFHPAIWWVERRLALEREMACDELVLAKTGNHHAYAECLVSLAEKTFARRGLALAQSVIGHATSTAVRLKRILGPKQAFKPRTYTRALAFAAVGVVLCVGLAPATPRLVAFQDHASANSEIPRAATQSAKSAYEFPGAVKIDAKFHPRKVGTISSAVSAQLHRKSNPVRAVVAKTKPAPAKEVLAREINQAVPASRTQFLVVMQTRVDGDGEVKTNWCVWKLTLRQSDNKAIRAQVVMSSL